MWLDYDKDGCVDAFIGRYVKFGPEYRNYYAADNYPGPLDYPPDSNVLLHNNCNGTFTESIAKATGHTTRNVRTTMWPANAFHELRMRPTKDKVTAIAGPRGSSDHAS